MVRLYFWEDDELAPEFARCIDIHRNMVTIRQNFSLIQNFLSFIDCSSEALGQEIGISYPYGSYSIGCGSCLRKSWG